MVIRLLLLLGVLLVPTLVWAQPACTHYADPAGTGSTCTLGTPCLINSFWAIAAPGDVLCLNDGTYQGFNSMIQPTTGLSGTSGNPITVRCPNEGQCDIDGQDIRIPVDLNPPSAWWHLIGLNAHNSSLEVYDLDGTNNITIERSIGWDGNPDQVNGNIFAFADAADITFIDVAAFGSGREQYGGTRAVRVTYDGCFGRNEGINLANDRVGMELNRAEETDHLVQNCILTIWNDPQWTGTGNTVALLNSSQSPGHVSNHRILNVIGYAKDGQAANFFHGNRQMEADSLLYENIVFAISADYPSTETIFARNETPPIVDVVYNNVTAFGTTLIQNQYQTNNMDLCPSSGVGCSSIFTSSTGANVCFKYENGVKTTTPMWPYPMQARLTAAMTQNDPTRVTIVEDDIEALFGPIPALCKTTTPVSVKRFNNGTMRNGDLR